MTEATIENLIDLCEARHGTRAPENVRRVTVADALVDTGVTTLSLPLSMIQELCLKKRHVKRANSSVGADHRIRRALEAVRNGSGQDRLFAYWLCLRRNIDCFEGAG